MQFSKIRSSIQKLIVTSRPRFWLYLAGPFLIGLGGYLDLGAVYMLFYFLIPANIFLYGVNDLWDQETDARNDKKSDKESRVTSQKEKSLLKVAVWVAFVLALPIIFMSNALTNSLLLIFFLLSYFYSAPPLRFKASPFIDSVSNVLYIFPALIAFTYVFQVLPPYQFIFAGALWTWAMHLFSAIPDIKPDKAAKIKTTAVVIGLRRSLMLCITYWAVSSVLLWEYPILFFGSLLYVITPLSLLFNNSSHKAVMRAYWRFPYINALIGFGLYLYRIFL